MRIEIQMQSLGVEQSSCCVRTFERGERMNAVVANDNTPLGWWCNDCIEKKRSEQIKSQEGK